VVLTSTPACEQKVVYVDKPVEKIVYVDKPVEKIVYQDKIVEKVVERPVEKIVYKDRIVYQDKPVEKIVYVDRVVEKPVSDCNREQQQSVRAGGAPVVTLQAYLTASLCRQPRRPSHHMHTQFLTL
jgi:hypothetical protein